MADSSKNDGRKVLAVTQGGPIRHGEAVRFDLKFEDGPTEQFNSDYPHFQQIVSQ